MYYKNSEWYNDPTAGRAMKKVSEELHSGIRIRERFLNSGDTTEYYDLKSRQGSFILP